MTVLFVVAHPDDEAFGPAGTIAKLSKTEKTVVVSMCNGARPTQEHVADTRQTNFFESCKLLGAEARIESWPDLELDHREATVYVEQLIRELRPRSVFTNNISDINKDHRTLADAVMIACRPKPGSCVENLYFFEVPSSTDWTFNKVQPSFQANVYVDISDYIELKKQAAGLYFTETYEFPDARSVESIETLSKYRGYQVGFPNAEAFQLVFSRCHRTL